LDLRIEKIGEAVVSGPRTVDLEIFSADVKQNLSTHHAEFVRSQFFNTGESERLRLPSFERHKAGYEFSADDLSIRDDLAIEEAYQYEIIEIEAEPEKPRLAKVGRVLRLNNAFATRFSGVTYGTPSRPKSALGSILKKDVTLEVSDAGYVAADSVSVIERAINRRPATVATAEVFARSPVVTESFSALNETAVRSTEVANDQVSSYIAAAVLKEAV
jgi:hypothetical protein